MVNETTGGGYDDVRSRSKLNLLLLKRDTTHYTTCADVGVADQTKGNLYMFIYIDIRILCIREM